MHREYDFVNFDTLPNNTISITTFVSPSFNAHGDDNPLTLAIQVDSQTPQVKQPMPGSVPGGLPDGWDGLTGFIANSIISVVTNFTAAPGAHTLKVGDFIK